MSVQGIPIFYVFSTHTLIPSYTIVLGIPYGNPGQ